MLNFPVRKFKPPLFEINQNKVCVLRGGESSLSQKCMQTKGNVIVNQLQSILALDIWVLPIHPIKI